MVRFESKSKLAQMADLLTADALKDGAGFVGEKTNVEESDSILGDTEYDLIGEIARGSDLTRQTAGKNTGRY